MKERIGARTQVRRIGPTEVVLYESVATGYKGFQECLRWAQATGLSAANVVVCDADEEA